MTFRSPPSRQPHHHWRACCHPCNIPKGTSASPSCPASIDWKELLEVLVLYWCNVSRVLWWTWSITWLIERNFSSTAENNHTIVSGTHTHRDTYTAINKLNAVITTIYTQKTVMTCSRHIQSSTMCFPRPSAPLLARPTIIQLCLSNYRNRKWSNTKTLLLFRLYTHSDCNSSQLVWVCDEDVLRELLTKK